MNIVETYNAILRDLEHLMDEMVFDTLKDALPSTLSHLLGAMESPVRGFPNQRDTLQFIRQHKDDIDEINAQYNQRKQEEQTRQWNPQPFNKVYNIHGDENYEEDHRSRYPAKKEQSQHSVSKN